jgi:invasion protein IalB
VTPRPAALSLALALAAALPAAAQQVAPADGPDTLVESYRDWVVRCAAPTADGTRQCEMGQEIRQRGEGGRRVLSMAVQRGEGETAQVTFLGPFGVRLADGMGLRIDEAEEPQLRLAFLTCVPDGCIVAAPLAPELLELLRGGSALEAEMVALNGETVRIGLSLTGFTAAWNRLGALR